MVSKNDEAANLILKREPKAADQVKQKFEFYSIISYSLSA
jgi:hypothetical protein